ncbi:MAG TPA: hypothetical protein EYP85_16285 [Armatimonadetes bacterium]|nr:hypothetical protein [Armatimonadota bacterium]
MSEHLGEVIESSTTVVRAQCRQWDWVPSLGALVRVDTEPEPVYGIVSHIATGSLDPYRRPTAYGKTTEELRREQPQIFELLKTEFQAVLVGYLEGERMRSGLPPQPPRLHSFVYLCGPEEVRRFTAGLEYLRLLLSVSSGVPADELLLTAARTAWEAHGYDRAYLIAVGKELARLLKDDYDRLRALLRRLTEGSPSAKPKSSEGRWETEDRSPVTGPRSGETPPASAC